MLMSTQFAMQTESRLVWDPEPYQRTAVRFLVSHPYAGLFLEPGMRKTSIMLAAIKLLLKKKLIHRVLIVTQLSVATDAWPPELDKWEDFRELPYRVAHGKERESALRDKDAKIVIINFEGLGALIEQCPVPGRKGHFIYLPRDEFRGTRWPFDALVCDESTRLKHTRTERFKRLKAVLPMFSRRYLLTGTPTPKGYLDLFGQIYLLDLGKSLGRYITHYRNKWFTPTGFGGYTWVINDDKAKQEIERAISPFILRLSSKTYQTLPPLRGAMGFEDSTPKIDWVDLPPTAMQKYKRLQHRFFVALDEGGVSAKNAGVAAMKCRQMANGGIYVDAYPGKTRLSTKRKIGRVHDAKLTKLLEILDKPGWRKQPVMIAYEFHHDLLLLRNALGADLPVLGGGVGAGAGSAKRKIFTATREAWNRGELLRMAVQPQSVAYGLNLQSAGYGIIFFALSWDTEAYIQLVRRLWRSGRHKPVYIRHIAARNTVDEVVLTGLQRDADTQNGLLNALDKYRRRRRGA